MTVLLMIDVFPVKFYTNLVFKMFKNCKISENCINLSALKNLKPVRNDNKRDTEREISI